MGIIFYGAFMPMGLIMRALKAGPAAPTIRPGRRRTYWVAYLEANRRRSGISGSSGA